MELLQLQNGLVTSFSICNQYEWLLNSYVLDFFTENHWAKLPKSWQSSLQGLTALEIAEFLTFNEEMRGRVWPLSMLALKRLLTTYSLNRGTVELKLPNADFMSDDKTLQFFWKGVKAKKRHEISIMSKICYDSAVKTDCVYIVDIGSGLGHLSRILNYGYGLKVCTIEAQNILSQQAGILDKEFEKTLKICNGSKTVHINKRLESDLTPIEFVKIIQNAFNSSDSFKFGIVGLHPCGDLGAILLQLFNNCSNIQFINIVGCCYMKLTTEGPVQGFPLSQFCRMYNISLSYHSREIACHAIENYVDKLKKEECWRLKIHTYRAILEKIIKEKYPKYQHCPVSSVKYTQDLTFENYCQRATKKLNMDFSLENFTEIENLLIQWRDVVVFYSLRLLFAPLIESIIHLDRLLYILEAGNQGEILSVFDPKISPRTHVLTAKKFSTKLT